MPYRLITDDHMRERLARGEAQTVEDTDVVEYDGMRWVRNTDVWVQDEQSGRGGLRRRSRRVPAPGHVAAPGAGDARDRAGAAEPGSPEAFPLGGLAAWRRPILCVTAGFAGTLLVLSAVAFHDSGPTTGTPRAVAPAPSPSSAPPAQELPDPSYPQDTPDATEGDPELEAGSEDFDSSAPFPEPEPEPPAVGPTPQDQDPLRPTLIGNTRPADPPPDDPATALAAVARRIDQAAARGQVSAIGEIVLRNQVRKIARALDGPPRGFGLGLGRGADGRGVDGPRLAAATGGLRTTVAGLALFRRIAPEAAVSIRSAVDQFERTTR